MKFNTDDPRWTAYVLGELDDADRMEVERILESSEEARMLVEELRTATAILKDELKAEAPLTLSPGQRAAIYAAAGPKSRRLFDVRPAVWAAGLAAACLILAAVITPLLFRPHPGDTQAGPSAISAKLHHDETLQTAEKDTVPAEPAPAAPRATANDEVKVQDALKDGLKKDGGTALPQSQIAVTETDNERSNLPEARSDVQNRLALQKEEAPASTPGRQAAAAIETQAKTLSSGVLGGVSVSPAAEPPATVLDRRFRPSFNTEAYDRITDNPFVDVGQNPLATFSIDVDTASYANVRRFLSQNQLPPKDAVRIEELINYFNYDYPQPSGPDPIAADMEVAAAPWNPDHRLVRIGIKGKEIDLRNRPSSNLVFLIDVSGSMQPPDKLPLLKSAMKLLVDKLGENDRVSIVVYAGASGMVLPPTNGDRKEVILRAIDRLGAGGSTNGASGIQLAYNLAVSNFIRGGINRVILATDGDFNVGITNQGDLIRLIEDEARSGVFLSVLGFGTGNLKDSTLEKLADTGNGNYAYIDTLNEARKVLVEEIGGTLITIAKDVKIQIEFNPAQVHAYRLIGYENRVLRNEDFNNDLKDAGDMGAGHTVTALFELVPPGVDISIPGVDPLKYQTPAKTVPSSSRETLTLKIRYKDPEGSQSKLLEVPLVDSGKTFSAASTDFRFAASVAGFGMILRDSPYKGNLSLDGVNEMATAAKGPDRNGYRGEFIGLVRQARSLLYRRQ